MNKRMKHLHITFLYLLLVSTGIIYLFGCNSNQAHKKLSADSAPAVENSSLQLPQGFTAVIVADSVGKARHLAVNSRGDIYVKLAALKNGKGIVYLHNTNSDGKTYEQTSFGDYGGTGLYIRDNYLYASSNEAVYRYRLNEDGQVIQPDQPELIVKGLIDRREHNSKSIVLDHKGNIYVNIGAYTNACQVMDRTSGSPGQTRCRAGSRITGRNNVCPEQRG
jgi:glucose/arabinose dehydrogenase